MTWIEILVLAVLLAAGIVLVAWGHHDERTQAPARGRAGAGR